MNYLFDDYGRYAGTSDKATTHSTTVAPDVLDATSNWNGYSWIIAPGVVTDNPGFAMTMPTQTSPSVTVSPVQFKLLFTSEERVAMDAAKADDPVLRDFFSIVDDPRLTYVDLGLQSTKDAVGYLALKGILTPERATEALAGVLK